MYVILPMWRDPWNLEFGGKSRFFEDIDREFAEAEEMLNRVFKTARETRPQGLDTSEPFFYGYQLTIGPDGKPHVREFGNLKPSVKGLVEQSGTREPLVDTLLSEKENTLTITAEMPGVTKQDIRVKVSEEYVSIHAEKGEKKYHSDIPVSVKLDEKSAKATYANGILELKIKLQEAPKTKSTEIKVE